MLKMGKNRTAIGKTGIADAFDIELSLGTKTAEIERFER